MSDFGHWRQDNSLPVFRYDADQDALLSAEWDPKTAPLTRRHWIMVGNKTISLQVANDGRSGILDERNGHRWLTCAEPGTGVSIINSGGEVWGSAFDMRGSGTPVRDFGPTWFRLETAQGGLELERTLLCPESGEPWVLVRVALKNNTDAVMSFTHCEEWAVRPRFVTVFATPPDRAANAEKGVRFDVDTVKTGASGCALIAREERLGEPGDFDRKIPQPDPQGGDETHEQNFVQIFGPTVDFGLEALGETVAEASSDGKPHPTLTLTSDIKLQPGETRTLWFRAGQPDDATMSEPADFFDDQMRQVTARLPRASAARADMAEIEIPWHAAILTGGLNRDDVIGGLTLNQSSAYLDPMGFNGAARDPLQHALPLVYIDPDAALGVLRNTCAWSNAAGELPYALDGAKQPAALSFRPSDQSLWAFLLGAEYCAATGDEAAFGEPLAYHPAYGAKTVTLQENLRRQFRHFVDVVGKGEHGHVRMLNADWNDMAIALSGVPREVMAQRGESVLNSAMAATVLPIYAGLCARLGDEDQAKEAREVGAFFRDRVAEEWNGRWFNRAWAPGKGPLGEKDCWLENQPWALLCGAADEEQTRTLLSEIDTVLRQDSPIGARVRGPVDLITEFSSGPGTGTDGGIWYAINMTLIWAASRSNQDLAWDEWRRMSLKAHADAYPGIWMGTLSGPDCYNGPEAEAPGETWGAAPISMQANPVNNMHSHAQPLLSYLRLLGVEADTENRLIVGQGASFSSPVLSISEGGHGWAETKGTVTLITPHGEVTGKGRLDW